MSKTCNNTGLHVATKMVKLKKKHRVWQGCGTNGIFTYCLWEDTLVNPFWKTIWQYLLKLNTCKPSDLAISLSGIPNRGANVCSPKDTHKNVHSRTIYKSQEMETTQCPSMPEWINKLQVYSSILR